MAQDDQIKKFTHAQPNNHEFKLTSRMLVNSNDKIEDVCAQSELETNRIQL